MANLYTGSGADSNRSQNLFLKAILSTNANYSSTTMSVTVSYTINKTVSTDFTDPGTRYGLLVSGASVDSSGSLTSTGTIIGTATLTQIQDKKGEQTGSVTFYFTKGTSAKTYSGVTFLINDNTSSTKRNSDSTFLWTGVKGSNRSSTPKNFAVTSFTVPVGITACTAPTSISISKQIQKPGGSVTLSWSGARAGTNNAITGYGVYKWDADKSVYSHIATVSTTAASGSYTYTLPSDSTRGNYHTFRVKTYGAKGETYYSSYTADNVHVTTNYLPTVSSLSASYINIPYSGGNSTITISGTDKDSSQTITYYYQKPNGSKTSFSSGVPISIPALDDDSKDDTYVIDFYAYDGLEYSSAKSLSFYRKAKPSITATFNKYYVDEDNKAYEYEYANGTYAKYYSAGSEIQNEGSNYDIEYRLYTSSSYDSGKYGVLKTGTKDKIYSFYILEKINELGLSYSTTDNFWINAVLTVDIGYSSKITVSDNSYNEETVNISGAFSLPSYPATGLSYNTQEKKILGKSVLYFDNYVRFYFARDEGVELSQVRVKNTSSGVTYSMASSNISFINSSEATYAEIKCEGLSRGEEYLFMITLTRGGNSFVTYSSWDAKTRIKTDFLQATGNSLSKTKIDARDWKNDIIATAVHNLGSLSYSTQCLYGLNWVVGNDAITTDESCPFSIKCVYNENPYTITKTTLTLSQVGLQAILTGTEDVQDIKKEFFNDTLNGTKTVDIYFIITNVFNESQQVKIGSLVYDYQKINLEGTSAIFKCSYNGGTPVAITSDSVLRNAYDLEIGFSGGKYYNSDPIKAILYAGFSTANNATPSYSKIAEKTYTNVTATSDGYDFGELATFKISKPFASRTDTKYIYLKAVLSQEGHSETKELVCNPVPRLFKHTAGNAEIVEAKGKPDSRDLQITFDMNVSDLGWDLINNGSKSVEWSYTTYMIYNNKEEQVQIYPSSSITDIDIKIKDCLTTRELVTGETTPSIVPFKVKISVTDTDNNITDSNGEKYSITKSFFTPYYYVYYQVPTFSYRKNQVSINCSPEDREELYSDCAVIITDYSQTLGGEKDKVLFVSSKDSNIYFSIDLSKGTINKPTIDDATINKPTIDGATIDSGSW